jgi:hypothetical protein
MPPPQGPPFNIGIVDVSNTETINYRHARSLEIDAGTVSTSFAVNATTAGTPVTVQAGQGGSAFTVGDGSVKGIHSQVTVAGSGSLVVDDSTATTRDQVTVTPTQVGAAALDHFFGSGGSLSYSGLSSLALNLSSANDDTVQLTPSADTAMTVNGSQAAFQAGHGALLSVDTTGATSPRNQTTAPGAGQWTFGNRQAVTYTATAVPVQNVSTQLTFTYGGFVYDAATHHYKQTVTLKNTSGKPIVGPLSLVLDSLKPGVKLVNRTGTTANLAPTGSPYIDIALAGNVLAAGQSVSVVLEFDSPTSAIPYTARAVAGTGTR